LACGEIVISTALASRGTDIDLLEEVVEKGGLHVNLLYLPKDSRTERQIIGRTGRKGLPGSSRVILNAESLEEQLGDLTELTDESKIKAQRDAIEACRVDGLQESLEAIIFQEQLFSVLCSKLEEFQMSDTFNPLEKRNLFLRPEILEPILKNRKLDFQPSLNCLKERWAMWYSINSLDIQEAAKDLSKKEELKQKLQTFLDTEIQELKDGKTQSFYFYIESAMERSLRQLDGHLTGDFVRSSWKQIEGLTSQHDHRYLSAVYYNEAYFLINEDSTSFDEALKLLKKAENALMQRMSDNVMEMTCARSFRPISHPHVVPSQKCQTNMTIQIQNRGVVIESFLKHIQETMQKLENFKKGDKKMKATFKDINSLFKDSKDPILTNELSVFAGDGHFQCYDVEEIPPPHNWVDGFLCFLIGVAQIAVGVAICYFSAGFASHIGMGLIYEGVSDCIEGAIGMYTGEFDWKQWAIGKAISLTITVACFGIGQACKWAKGGFKTGNIVKNLASRAINSAARKGAKESLKHALKYTAKTFAVQGTVALVDKAIDKGTEELFRQAFSDLKTSLIQSVQDNTNLHDKIVSAWLALKRSGNEVDLNENVLHLYDKDFQSVLQYALFEAFEAAAKENEAWKQFTQISKKLMGPISQVLDKTLFKRRNVAALATKAAINTTLSTIDLTITSKEMAAAKKNITDKVATSIDKKFDTKASNKGSKEWNDFTSNKEVMKVIKKEEEALANEFADMFVERMTAAASGLVGSALKPFATYKVEQAMSKLTKIHQHEEYFKSKRHQNKMLFKKAPTREKTNTSKDDIIKEMMQGPSNEIDIRALQKETGKKVVIETFDEKGKKINTTEYGEGTDVIKLKHTKRKREDGRYEGHYELNHNGNVIPNSGDGQRCIYHCFKQAEDPSKQFSKDHLNKEAEKLQKEVLNKHYTRLWGELHIDHKKHEDSSSGKFNLSGGGTSHETSNSKAKAKKDEEEEEEENKTDEKEDLERKRPRPNLDNVDDKEDCSRRKVSEENIIESDIGEKARNVYTDFFENRVYVPIEGHTGGKEKGPETLGDQFGLKPHSNTQYGYMEVTLNDGTKVRHGHIFNGKISDRCYNHIHKEGEKSGTPAKKKESDAKKTKVFNIDNDGNIIPDTVKNTKLHSETAFIHILEEKYKDRVAKVEVFTSQSPCFHDTFTPSKAKKGQKTPCSENLKEYAKKNEGVKLDVYFDTPYNPRNNRMNKEIPKVERTSAFVERKWLEKLHNLPDNYKVFKKTAKSTPTKFRNVSKQREQREE
jgi:hypothetical protein